MFWRENQIFFHLKSRFCLGSEHMSFVFVFCFVTAWTADGIVVDICCFQLISAEIKIVSVSKKSQEQNNYKKYYLIFSVERRKEKSLPI